MRVLIATNASRSCLFSMVPLAWALRSAGHEVRVATRPSLVDTAADTGLTVVSVGEGPETEDTASVEPARAGIGGLALSTEELEGMSWRELVSTYEALTHERLKAINEPILDDLVLLCRQWRPDLVLWDPTTLAGAVAARACGAAHGRFLWSLDLIGSSRGYFLERLAVQDTDEQSDPLREWLAPRAESHGVLFTEELLRGDFALTHLTAALDEPSNASRAPERLRHIHYGGQTTIPVWLRDTIEQQDSQDSPKRVLVDWRATDSTGTDPEGSILRGVLEGLSALPDLEVVLVVPEGRGEEPVDPPGVTRTVEQGALHALAPTCSLAVHTGGVDVFCEAGLHGVPQLVLPEPGLADAVILADRLVTAGAGTALRREAVEADTVTKEAARLLTDPAVAQGSARLRDEIEAAPTPDLLVDRIERLVCEHARNVPSQG